MGLKSCNKVSFSYLRVKNSRLLVLTLTKELHVCIFSSLECLVKKSLWREDWVEYECYSETVGKVRLIFKVLLLVACFGNVIFQNFASPVCGENH